MRTKSFHVINTVILTVGILLACCETGTATRMTITFDGYDPPGTTDDPLTNFPALLELNTNIGSRVNIFDYETFRSSEGYDLRFKDSTGTTLNYEIEQWNTNGTSYVWVQVPLLTNGTMITASWGSGTGAQESYTTNGSTWSSYDGVWHMNGLSDATTGNDDLLAQGSSLPFVTNAGVVGSCYDFGNHTNGATLIVPSGSPANTTESDGVFTVSAWLLNRRRPEENAGGFISTKPYIHWSQGFRYDFKTWDYGQVIMRGNGTSATFAAGTDWRWPSWIHLATVFDGTNYTTYVDGLGVATNTTGSAIVHKDGARLGFGSTDYSGYNYTDLNGRLDEIRMHPEAQSADWIWAEYNNMNEPTFATYEILPSGMLFMLR